MTTHQCQLRQSCQLILHSHISIVHSFYVPLHSLSRSSITFIAPTQGQVSLICIYRVQCANLPVPPMVILSCDYLIVQDTALKGNNGTLSHENTKICSQQLVLVHDSWLNFLLLGDSHSLTQPATDSQKQPATHFFGGQSVEWSVRQLVVLSVIEIVSQSVYVKAYILKICLYKLGSYTIVGCNRVNYVT